MSTVIAQRKTGETIHHIDCTCQARGDKFVVSHSEPDDKFGGMQTEIQHVYDIAELVSIKEVTQ